ncbi:hypothetical protein K4K96_10945 [Phaeobacter inhibens]|uniref:hypothetical protein n=1 Tax=Phaeobacter inhibens TaxID=221822 RepID=UPI0021A41174|nr:hypothetical protein [Phaeobacter inhibens]UWR91230.1 hypothetical protein K4K96_10945 [Phaeobacter inhibens]
MKKTLITSATALAIVLNAGMSMAGPLDDHSFGGKAHDVRSSVSQAFDHETTVRSFDPSQKNLSWTQSQSQYGTSWSSELPDEVVVEIQDGPNMSIIIGKAPDDLSNCVYVRGGMTFC